MPSCTYGVPILVQSRMPSTNERIPRPSASAAPRIMFVRIAPAASGFRPIASDDFAVRMPMPRPGPMTPRPTARPAARPWKSMRAVPLLCVFSSSRYARSGCDRFWMLFGTGDAIGVRVTPLLVRFVVRLDREHEVHENEQREHQPLDETDEHLEPDERQREPRHEQERAHHEQHDLATEHVAPETKGQREHAEELAEQLDEPDHDEDRADERTVLEAAEVEPALHVADAEIT